MPSPDPTLWSDRLTATLNFKTDHIGDEFTEIAANLQHMMSVRLDRVTEGFSQKSVGILDMMTGRTQQLTDLVVETGNNLADAIGNRVEEVNTTLKNSLRVRASSRKAPRKSLVTVSEAASSTPR